MRKNVLFSGLAIACRSHAAHAEESLTNGFKNCASLESEYQVGFHSSRKLQDSKLIVEVKNGRWFNFAKKKKGLIQKQKVGKANKWVEVNKHVFGKARLGRVFFIQSQAFPSSEDLWDRLANDANRKYVSEKSWSLKCTYTWVATQDRDGGRNRGGKSEQKLKNFNCASKRQSPHTFFGEGWFDVPAKSSGALCNVIKEKSGEVLRVRIKFDPRI